MCGFQVCNCPRLLLHYLLLHANHHTTITPLDTFRQGYTFWSDVTADTISRAKLDGSEVTVLVNSGLSSVGK